MPQFRKRPVVIEAVQWFKAGDHPGVKEVFQADEGGSILIPMTSEALERGMVGYHRAPAINTAEGWFIVTPGDWIIRGVKDQFYPCKPDIFALTYDPVGIGEGLEAAGSLEIEDDEVLEEAARELIEQVKKIGQETTRNLRDLVTAARAFSNKMAAVEVDERWKRVWSFYAVHGMRYSGPYFQEELEALRTALRTIEWLGL